MLLFNLCIYMILFYLYFNFVCDGKSRLEYCLESADKSFSPLPCPPLAGSKVGLAAVVIIGSYSISSSISLSNNSPPLINNNNSFIYSITRAARNDDVGDHLFSPLFIANCAGIRSHYSFQLTELRWSHYWQGVLYISYLEVHFTSAAFLSKYHHVESSKRRWGPSLAPMLVTPLHQV